MTVGTVILVQTTGIHFYDICNISSVRIWNWAEVRQLRCGRPVIPESHYLLPLKYKTENFPSVLEQIVGTLSISVLGGLTRNIVAYDVILMISCK